MIQKFSELQHLDRSKSPPPIPHICPICGTHDGDYQPVWEQLEYNITKHPDWDYNLQVRCHKHMPTTITAARKVTL
jgi:hypothetical protein